MVDSLLKISGLSENNLSEVMAVQSLCFQKIYCEDRFVYEILIKIFPKGAWGAFYEDRLIAYIFFHPYYNQKVKPLNSGLVLNGNEDSMYLHEIAVLPEYQTHHIPDRLLNEFDKISNAYQMKYQSLVCVQNSMEFWRKKGFSLDGKVDDGGYIDGFMMSKTFAALT